MEGGLDLIEMWHQMGFVAKAVAWILFFMSMWSIGVAVERIYTFMQAKNQSKVYAPQVAKHLKDGRLKDAIAISTNKNYRYSHLAKVVLAGLQEYQFQQENAGGLSREELAQLGAFGELQDEEGPASRIPPAPEQLRYERARDALEQLALVTKAKRDVGLRDERGVQHLDSHAPLRPHALVHMTHCAFGEVPPALQGGKLPETTHG